MSLSGKRRGSRDFNYAGLDGGEDGGGDLTINPEDVAPEDVCPKCSIPVSNWDPAIQCESCLSWFHTKCEAISPTEYRILMGTPGMALKNLFCQLYFPMNIDLLIYIYIYIFRHLFDQSGRK